jgi:hypothetical protein
MTEETKQFLITGLETYDSGFRAMARFHQEIYRAARRSMVGNLEQLALVTGLKLDDRKMKPFARPDGFREEGEWENLDIGVSLDTDTTATIRAALRWRLDHDSGVQRVALVRFTGLRAPTRKAVLASARAVEHNAVRDGSGKVWLEEPVTAANIAEFEGLLNGIFERWVKIFEKTGGFPKQP